MAKYRALFHDKKLIAVESTREQTPSNDTFLEQSTDATIWAIIEASSKKEANEKAMLLEEELQSGQTKQAF